MLHPCPSRGWNVPRPLPSGRWTTGMSNPTSLSDKKPDHLPSRPMAYTDNRLLPGQVAPRLHQWLPGESDGMLRLQSGLTFTTRSPFVTTTLFCGNRTRIMVKSTAKLINRSRGVKTDLLAGTPPQKQHGPTRRLQHQLQLQPRPHQLQCRAKSRASWDRGR